MSDDMTDKFRIFCRASGVWYIEDRETREQESLRTRDVVEAKDLPSEGILFPNLSRMRASDRATEFKSRCRRLGIEGVTLHNYRYAWAERARTAGYPQRYAQEALGHNSKAVHQAYAKKADVEVPSLDEWEKQMKTKVKGIRTT